MAKGSHKTRLIYSYLALRQSIGWIGILLPFVLALGMMLIMGTTTVYESISYYYHTDMRDVFVGALCAVALFLFFYSGYDQKDNWAGNLAGLFAIGVAWCPTTKNGPGDLTGRLHFVFAALFFITLAVFSLFLFTKKNKRPTPQKLKRNWIYRICGLAMIACLITIILFKFMTKNLEIESDFVFWAESVALFAFGLSWLTKGGALFRDAKTKNRSNRNSLSRRPKRIGLPGKWSLSRIIRRQYNK